MMWCIQGVGDAVKEDEVVCEIETDKVSFKKIFELNQLPQHPVHLALIQ
jgi:Biotin-requiring enzyme